MPPLKILILGGYGVFGRRVARGLSNDPSIELIIAGRDEVKAQELAIQLNARAAAIDVHSNLSQNLAALQPYIVINCCGPFQGQDYGIARLCITHHCHYIDLADGRDYVANFTQLDELAKSHSVTAVTGASSVPAISACVVDDFAKRFFSEIQTLDFGINLGNQTERGVATVASILSYVGKPFTTLINGTMQTVIGWQNLHRRLYPVFGKRFLANCDIPDLVLFPARYPTLRTIRFYAGLELPLLHLGVWLLSWLTRWNLVSSWQPYAAFPRTVSLWFYLFGSVKGGMYLAVSGLDVTGRKLTKTFYLIADSGDGPQIPATPAIVLARRMIAQPLPPGAYPCMGLFELFDILSALKPFKIESRIV